jgi:preprotein translocase subunit SecA
LLEYDNVANEQRQIIYSQRNEILESIDLADFLKGLRHGCLTAVARRYIPHESIEEQWDIDGLTNTLLADYQIDAQLRAALEEAEELDDEALVARVCRATDEAYAAKLARLSPGAFLEFERSMLLHHIDHAWREHLAALDHLRQGIHLRGYAQKDPKQEYKREAFALFEQLLERVRDDVTRVLITVQISSEEEAAKAAAEAAPTPPKDISFTHADFKDQEPLTDEGLAVNDQASPETAGTVRREFPKVGRNDPCPCGSGKKYKHCHGALA